MAHRKHEKEIRAWLDGAVIQYKTQDEHGWHDCPSNQPSWLEVNQYRIKPAEQEREYPKTNMSGRDLEKVADRSPIVSGSPRQTGCARYTAIANAALRHACDEGQVVTRAEFDRAIGDRAARDMLVAKAAASCCFWNISTTAEANRVQARVTEAVLKDVISNLK